MLGRSNIIEVMICSLLELEHEKLEIFESAASAYLDEIWDLFSALSLHDHVAFV